MITRDIINILEKKFPKINAEEWDNVGLLVGDYDKEVKKIQFSIDASLEVIENAIKEKVDMIITHHPFIFKAIKSINEQDILSKKIRALIRNDINIYSIHTNLDSSVSGLNDYVLEKLGYTDYKFLDYDEEKNCGIGRIFKLDEEKDLKKFIEELKLKLQISNLRVISNDLNKKIKKVALINGSAMSYWRKAKKEKIDLFITGDVGYHDALDARESGLAVIDFGHYESEHFFHEVLIKELKETNGENMRKIIITFLFLISSVFSFATINDNLNILKDEEKVEINEKVEEIKKEKDLTVFVNTLSMDVGFAVSDPERALILNIKKGDKETYKVELSFSKDIDVDDYQDDINTTLTDAAPLLERKEYGKYILTVLDGASSVLQEVNIEALNQMTMTKEQENGSSTPIMIAAFVIIILFIVYKMYAAYKDKSNQEEDDD